jgi:hypothetical protein
MTFIEAIVLFLPNENFGKNDGRSGTANQRI